MEEQAKTHLDPVLNHQEISPPDEATKAESFALMGIEITDSLDRIMLPEDSDALAREINQIHQDIEAKVFTIEEAQNAYEALFKWEPYKIELPNALMPRLLEAARKYEKEGSKETKENLESIFRDLLNDNPKYRLRDYKNRRSEYTNMNIYHSEQQRNHNEKKIDRLVEGSFWSTMSGILAAIYYLSAQEEQSATRIAVALITFISLSATSFIVPFTIKDTDKLIHKRIVKKFLPPKEETVAQQDAYQIIKALEKIQRFLNISHSKAESSYQEINDKEIDLSEEKMLDGMKKILTTLKISKAVAESVEKVLEDERIGAYSLPLPIEAAKKEKELLKKDQLRQQEEDEERAIRNAERSLTAEQSIVDFYATITEGISDKD